MTAIGSFGVRKPPETRVVPGQHVERVLGRVVERERFRHDDPRPALAQRLDRRPRRLQVVRAPAGQPFEFEGVRRRDGRQRQRAVAEEFADARGDIRAASDVADHRIAGVSRFAIGGAHARERAQGRFADLGFAEIAGQEPGAAGKRADRLAIRRRTRRSCRRRRRGRASRRSRHDSRTAPSSAARPRVRAAAAERPPPNCRHGRRRHATGWKGSARAWPTRRQFGGRRQSEVALLDGLGDAKLGRQSVRRGMRRSGAMKQSRMRDRPNRAGDEAAPRPTRRARPTWPRSEAWRRSPPSRRAVDGKAALGFQLHRHRRNPDRSHPATHLAAVSRNSSSRRCATPLSPTAISPSWRTASARPWARPIRRARIISIGSASPASPNPSQR